jgi:uncharacterized protein YndB with AHSA1/START domain
MARTIEQVVTFKAPPARVYQTYLNAREHGAACGWGRVKMTPKVGGRMQVAPHISGTFLWLVPGRVIAQTWRGADWKASETDSLLLLTLERTRGGCRMKMVHANVPDAHARSITAGWRQYYWKPWKAHLRKPHSR